MEFSFLFVIILAIFVFCFLPKNFITNIISNTINTPNIDKLIHNINNKSNSMNNNIEGFEVPADYSFIGIDNDDKKNLIFYHPVVEGNNKYLRYVSPSNTTIKQYAYEDTLLVILTDDNKIFYCNNCDLSGFNINWKELKVEGKGIIKMISIDKYSGNRLFLLNEQGAVFFNNNMINNGEWKTINLPAEDLKFKYIDSYNGLFAGIGDYTNFVYYVEIVNITSIPVPWTIIDKSKIMNEIKITQYGFLGKSGPDGMFLCTIPCDGNGNRKWKQLNNLVSSSIDANTEIISLVKNQALYKCDTLCSPNSITPLTFNDKFNLYKASVIDYKFPTINRVDAVPPVDNTILNQLNASIQENIKTHGDIKDAIQEINQKIDYLDKNKQLMYEKLNPVINSTNDKVRSIIDGLGFVSSSPIQTSELFKNIENFSTKLDKNTILTKINQLTTVDVQPSNQKLYNLGNRENVNLIVTIPKRN
jgi:hypothetical protein